MKNRGSIILAVIFMILIVFLGLSLLNFTLIHNRITKSRNIHRTRSELLHNLLILNLHLDTEKIKNTTFNSSVENFSDYFNKNTFPDRNENNANIIKSFSSTLRDLSMFKIIRSVFEIEATSADGRHKWRSESIFNIITGNIPFNFLPVIINSTSSGLDKQNFNDINIRTTGKNRLFISKNNIIFDIKVYLAQVLGIHVSELSLIRIIELFRESNETGVPNEGIFFKTSGNEAGPVFVQGCVDKITLSAENEYQILELVQKESRLKIKYSSEQFLFESDRKSGSGTQKFNEIIIINGDVHKFGSGGIHALTGNAHPEFIVLGNINICSSINSENQFGSGDIPSGITIISAPSPFSEIKSSPVLSFSGSGPFIIKGSININGEIINENSEILILGNLYGRELLNSGIIKVDTRHDLKPISNNNFYIKDAAFIRDFRTETIEEFFEDEK